MKIYKILLNTGEVATGGIAAEQIWKHRADALATSANDTPSLTFHELIQDKWDASAVHFCISRLSTVEQAGDILASIRISRVVDDELPLSELYKITPNETDVEIGRTTVVPHARGGYMASLLLIKAMHYLEEQSASNFRIFVDPIVGARRGISITTLEAMGFTIASPPVVDHRYDLGSQALVMESRDILNFWRWRDAHYNPATSTNPYANLLLSA